MLAVRAVNEEDGDFVVSDVVTVDTPSIPGDIAVPPEEIEPQDEVTRIVEALSGGYEQRSRVILTPTCVEVGGIRIPRRQTGSQKCSTVLAMSPDAHSVDGFFKRRQARRS